MVEAGYPPPLDELLRRGLDEPFGSGWPDYLAFGLGPEHIPDLIRMATDPELAEADSGDPRVWAPVHAWRALGQLRAEEAVGPLLESLTRHAELDDDWGLEELPVVFGMIGPAAIPALEAFLADESRRLYARTAITSAFEYLVRDHPQTRDAGVAALERALDAAERNDPALNGFIISALITLDAKESAPRIERAFAEDLVDESIAGSWEEVRFALGLGPPPPPRQRSWTYLDAPPRRVDPKKARARRKQVAKSSKQNRKRR